MIVLVMVAFMVERDGGFAITVWYPVALVLLGVVVAMALSARSIITGLPRSTVVAIGSLAAFVAWGFATIAWAAVRGDAWDGSNQALFYLLVFALLASWPVTGAALWPLLLGLSAVVAAEGVITVEQVIRAGDPSRFLIGTRLSEPLGYPNATAALFMIMAILMIGLASRPWLPAPARALAFGLAGLDAVLNLLTESRGSVFTFPLVVIVFVLIVPGRLRSIAAFTLVALAFAPVIRPILHLYGTDQAQFSPDLKRAMDLGFVWAVVLAAAGWLFAAIDDRLEPTPRMIRNAGVVVTAAIVLGLAGVLGVTKPWDHVSSAWHSFKYAGEPTGAASHFGGLGSQRYDVWRVGLIEFKRHPIQGIGVGNFLVPYLEQRHSNQEPIYPHSLLIRLLSQTGIVGTALFAAFLAFALSVALRIPAGRERDLARVLVAGASVWLLHGLVDWLWEMPVLGVLGMGLLGLACGLAPRRASPVADAAPPGRRPVRIAIAVAGLGAAVVAAVSFALPWFAERDVQNAAVAWQTNPAAALSTLERAHSLNPLDDEADQIAGAIASRLHRYDVMRTRFQAAVNRTPDNWYSNLELGIAASLTGRHALAASSLARARQLDPGEPIVRDVLATFNSGRRINSDAIDREFQESG